MPRRRRRRNALLSHGDVYVFDAMLCYIFRDRDIFTQMFLRCRRQLNARHA